MVFPNINAGLGTFAPGGMVRDPLELSQRLAQVAGLGSGWVSSYLKACLTLQDFFLLGERQTEQRAEVSSGPLVIAKVLKILFTDEDFAPLPFCS